MKMMEFLEHVFCQERQRDLGLPSLAKTQEDPTHVCKYLIRGAKKAETKPSQWCSWTGQETTGMN